MKLPELTKEEKEIFDKFNELKKQFSVEMKTLFQKHFSELKDLNGNGPEFVTFVTIQNPPIYKTFGYGCQHCMVIPVRDWADYYGSHKEKDLKEAVLNSLLTDTETETKH